MEKSNRRYRPLSNKARFKRGFRRYFSKNHNYGWKAFHRRIRYRNMLWERAPVSFIVAVIVVTFFVILIDLFKVEIHPLLVFLLIGIYVVIILLEIWYVGDE
ncbi:MAG: hypothetical protein ACW98F_15875 [Candidatus Hodarchaeales archaeon]|jgi:hypothetical protein